MHTNIYKKFPPPQNSGRSFYGFPAIVQVKKREPETENRRESVCGRHPVRYFHRFASSRIRRIRFSPYTGKGSGQQSGKTDASSGRRGIAPNPTASNQATILRFHTVSASRHPRSPARSKSGSGRSASGLRKTAFLPGRRRAGAEKRKRPVCGRASSPPERAPARKPAEKVTGQKRRAQRDDPAALLLRIGAVIRRPSVCSVRAPSPVRAYRRRAAPPPES